ncbi:MAG: carbohydrate-binding protein, partial [Pedobacter sp.]
FATSCETEKLDDVTTKENYAGVNITVPAKSEIAAGSNFVVTGGEVQIPVVLNFSGPTTRAFTVNLTAVSDNTADLITAGVLPAGTEAAVSGTFNVPSVVNVPVGVSSYAFNLTISRSAIEVAYGKNLAMTVRVSNPAKSNNIEAGKDQAVILVKTTDIIAANSVHNISFGTTAKVFAVPTPGTYEIGSTSITIRVPINIQGELGTAFTVQALNSQDSIAKYIADGTLTNVAAYSQANISITNSTINFDANTRTSYLTFSIRRDALMLIQEEIGKPTVKMPVIAFRLANPSKYQLDKAKSLVLIKFDVNFFRAYYGNPFLIKGTINAVSDPIYGAYYDYGGQGRAYNDNAGKDGDGSWRFPDGVDVSGDYNPRTVVGWISTDEWLTYTVFVEENGTYEMDNYLGSSNSNGRYRVFLDNKDISGELAVTSTGAHNNQRSHKSTVQLTKGLHILKMYWTRGDHDWRGVIFTRKS